MQRTGADFMELTQYDRLSPSDQNLKKAPPPLAKPVPKGARYIPLQKPGTITVPPLDLRQAIEGRRSLRHYRKDPLTIEEFCVPPLVHPGNRAGGGSVLHTPNRPIGRGAPCS